jgi:hypothetical protein
MKKREYKVLKSVHSAMQKGYDNSNGNLPQNLNLAQYFKFRDIYDNNNIQKIDNPIHNVINAKSNVQYIYMLSKNKLRQGFIHLRKTGDTWWLKSVIQSLGAISAFPSAKCARHSQQHKLDNIPF